MQYLYENYFSEGKQFKDTSVNLSWAPKLQRKMMKG
jgi:hypothetical protein